MFSSIFYNNNDEPWTYSMINLSRDILQHRCKKRVNQRYAY